MAGLSIDNPEAPTLAWLRPRNCDNRYRLVVLCESAADAVSAAGGWLFDRSLAGCEVTVLLTGPADSRALRILGARAIELETALASEVCGGQPYTLAVAAELFRRDARVRHSVLETINEGLTNIIMWGDAWPSELEGLVTPVEHELSIAARAFKKAALAAAGASPGSVGTVETFRGIDLRACRSPASRLVTAS